MTYEQAAYFRLLLLLGFPEPLDAFFDDALEREDPLSDVILSLVDCGSDRKAQLAVLHEYTQAAQVDYAVVGRYVLDFACAKKDEGWPLEKVTDLLWRAYKVSGRDDEPWWSMMVCSVWHDDAKWNRHSMEEFVESFDNFLRGGEMLSVPVRTTPKQESFWQKLRKWWKR